MSQRNYLEPGMLNFQCSMINVHLNETCFIKQNILCTGDEH